MSEGMKDTNNIFANNNSGSMTFNISQEVMRYLLALLLAGNLLATIVLYQAYRHEEQTEDLKRYDLDFFKQNDWATLKSQVETQRALIEAYGLQNAAKAAIKEN